RGNNIAEKIQYLKMLSKLSEESKEYTLNLKFFNISFRLSFFNNTFQLYFGENKYPIELVVDILNGFVILESDDINVLDYDFLELKINNGMFKQFSALLVIILFFVKQIGINNIFTS